MQEIEIPENPLEKGALLKIKANAVLRILGKKFFVLSFKMPFAGTMMFINETLRKHKISDVDLLDPEKFKEIFALKRKVLYKLVAIAVLNDYFGSKLIGSMFAFWLRGKVSREQVYTILNMYVNFGGTREFEAMMKMLVSATYTAKGLIYGKSKEGVQNG